ncbi:protein-S-isoprenylcysteine O-methyltransferase-like [Ptychodera flava]|uniref:protein-S-isoprenylcysteine O-methyltransferase-like n=1 Tax=Ptychodera flava TaxID=63121 RepID=UPI00396A371E
MAAANSINVSVEVARRVCLQSFFLGAGLLIVPFIHIFTIGFVQIPEFRHGLIGGLSYVAVVAAIVLVRYKGYSLKIATRACFLGFVFSFGIIISAFAAANWTVFGWYLCILSFFHFSEYFCTSLYHPRSLTLDSFLLNHSKAYHVAAMASWTEFILETLIFPSLKQIQWLSLVGLTICLFGEVLRKLAMFTAGTSFNHMIQSRRNPDHVLVTHGIYAWCRHPSYVGWFWWSVATQLLLCNPICLVAYTVASWQFFNERIEDEEILLLNFFGEEYIDYQKKVGTGLPWIRGYTIRSFGI